MNKEDEQGFGRCMTSEGSDKTGDGPFNHVGGLNGTTWDNMRVQNTLPS